MAGLSASRRWQARTWQDSRSVTGVTERVLRRGDFTPFLQLANLICAIAPPGRECRGTIWSAPPRPSRAVRNAPAQTRSSPHGTPAGPDRTRGFRRPARAVRPRPDVARAQKDRAGPGGVQRDRTTHPYCTGMAPVGAGARHLELWVGLYGLGDPEARLLRGDRGCVRPRCAAAEYPQAVRGPLPRGTGDVHRACGWT